MRGGGGRRGAPERVLRCGGAESAGFGGRGGGPNPGEGSQHGGTVTPPSPLPAAPPDSSPCAPRTAQSPKFGVRPFSPGAPKRPLPPYGAAADPPPPPVPGPPHFLTDSTYRSPQKGGWGALHPPSASPHCPGLNGGGGEKHRAQRCPPPQPRAHPPAYGAAMLYGHSSVHPHPSVPIARTPLPPLPLHPPYPFAPPSLFAPSVPLRPFSPPSLFTPHPPSLPPPCPFDPSSPLYVPLPPIPPHPHCAPPPHFTPSVPLYPHPLPSPAPPHAPLTPPSIPLHLQFPFPPHPPISFTPSSPLHPPVPPPAPHPAQGRFAPPRRGAPSAAPGTQWGSQHLPVLRRCPPRPALTFPAEREDLISPP